MLILFYDGSCGLCHRAVRWLARADGEGRVFAFAPLGGATFESLVSPEARETLPDSLVALSEERRLFARSAALLVALERLGPGWRGVAVLLRLVPQPLRDAAYDLLARSRRRWFGSPESCPIAPEDAGRFLP